MEKLLKEQFANTQLILCEFEKDFMNEVGNLEEIHDILQTVVNRARDIMADYCFDQYDYITEVIDDEIEMMVNLFEKCDEFKQTIFIPYINSMLDVVIETIKTYCYDCE